MRISRLRAAVLVAGIMLSTLFAVPGTSSASSTDGFLILPVGPLLVFPELPDYQVGARPNGDWKVGDCHMMFGSFVAISGQKVLLRGITGTDHTNNADIWHSAFTFMDADGRPLYRAMSGAFDSPRMVPSNGQSSGPSDVYHWEREVRLTVDPLLALRVASVRWQSSC